MMILVMDMNLDAMDIVLAQRYVNLNCIQYIWLFEFIFFEMLKIPTFDDLGGDQILCGFLVSWTHKSYVDFQKWVELTNLT